MKPFHLRDTLESGQIFRYRYDETGAWVCHMDQVFHIGHDGTVTGTDTGWARHFLRNDQPELSHTHPYAQAALRAHPGLRILRQDPWECLIAFIISQNNHQQRIKHNVTAVTEAFGKPVSHGFFSMPLPHELGNEEELRKRGLGYRAAHITACKNISRTWLYHLREKPYAEARNALMTLSGVGPKVADCVLLFSLGFDDACPEDTWMRRIFQKTGLNKELLGPQAGLLQQYLFHYARTQDRLR